MAVELRCPECRAKLRLPDDPEPGTDVECPKCSNVFAAPDPDTGEVPDSRGEKKKSAGEKAKKKPAADAPDGEKKPEEKKPAPEGKKPKKRRAKKHKSNPAVLWAAIGGGVLFLALVVSLLVWYFMRKPATYEMMGHLPADCDSVTGLHVGHLQKYPEFFKTVQSSYSGTGFVKAAVAVGKALGVENVNDILDYVLYGEGKSGFALVLRMKREIDTGALSKLPGAQERAVDGRKVYSVDSYRGSGRMKAFAPTNRLVVFCDDAIPDATLRQMLGGNKDNDKAVVPRMGPLAKRITRGTFWHVQLYETAESKPQQPPPSKEGREEPGSHFAKQFADISQPAKGYGFKASVGSREIRLEYAVWFRDGETANTWYDKYKSSELAKGDEVDPPKWWTDVTRQLGDKKIGQEMLNNLGAKSSGEMFVIYTACDTKSLMFGIGSVVGKITGQSQGGMGGPGGMPGGGPPGGMPPPGGGGPPAPGPAPKP